MVAYEAFSIVTSDSSRMNPKLPHIEHAKEFRDYLRSLKYRSYSQYSSHLRTASTILGQSISPSLVPNQEAVEPLLARLERRKPPGRKVYMSATRSALQRYAELVELEFLVREANPEGLLNRETVVGRPAVDLDIEVLAPAVRTEVSRIIRNSAIVKEVKAIHANRCQLCKDRLELLPGQYYSEAHHLKPLGQPHDGPDVLGNLICVCPTCHVKLDYAVVSIKPNELLAVEGHQVNEEYIEYHNDRLCANGCR